MSERVNELHRLYWSEHWPIRKIDPANTVRLEPSAAVNLPAHASLSAGWFLLAPKHSRRIVRGCGNLILTGQLSRARYEGNRPISEVD